MNKTDHLKVKDQEIEGLKNEIESLKRAGFKSKLIIDVDTPLFKLTVGEFLELMERTEQPQTKVFDTTIGKKEYGMGGIARIFGCSLTTANKIKQSGKIDGAITQHGRTIVIDIEKALELGKGKKQ